MDLGSLSSRALLGLHYAVLAQLRTNEVVRSSNSPIADYAELLVQRAYGGVLNRSDLVGDSWVLETRMEDWS